MGESATSSEIRVSLIDGPGFAIFERSFSAELAAALRHQVMQRLELGRDTVFMDDDRMRVFHLLGTHRGFEELVTAPLVLEAAGAFLGCEPTLSALTAHVIPPHATPQPLHVDYPYFMMDAPFPDTRLQMQVIWALEDFTLENGAPRFLPQSQTLRRHPDRETFERGMVTAALPAGSLILSHGGCWHDTMINRSDQPRVSLLAAYTPPWVRSIEDLPMTAAMAFPPFDRHLQELTGQRFHEVVKARARASR